MPSYPLLCASRENDMDWPIPAPWLKVPAVPDDNNSDKHAGKHSRTRERGELSFMDCPIGAGRLGERLQGRVEGSGGDRLSAS